MRRCIVIGLFAVSIGGCATSRSAHADSTAKVQLALAEKLAEQRDWERALQAANAACIATPANPDALTMRGTILRERGLLDEAENDLVEAIERAPGSARAHSALAIVYERKRKMAEGELHHRRAHELEPNNAKYTNNLGYALLLRGRTREAIPLLASAVHGDPTNARLRNNLGFAYARANDFTRAAQQFEAAGAPAAAQANLGLAYELHGNVQQAVDHYRTALRLDPDLRTARERLAALTASSLPAAGHSAPAAPGPHDGSQP